MCDPAKACLGTGMNIRLTDGHVSTSLRSASPMRIHPRGGPGNGQIRATGGRNGSASSWNSAPRHPARSGRSGVTGAMEASSPCASPFESGRHCLHVGRQGTLGPLQLLDTDDFLSIRAKCKNLRTQSLSSPRNHRSRPNHRSLRHRQ